MSAPAVGRADVGLVELCTPRDWTDVLLSDDGEDPRTRLGRLVRVTWPGGSEELHTGVVDLLLTWRERMLAQGAVSHGLVHGPRADGSLARWQVLSSVVPIPAEPEVDAAGVLAQMLGSRWSDVQHVERYETDMGLGLGVIAQPEMSPPPELDALEQLGLRVVREPVRIGVAMGLAWAPGDTRALLVVGVCPDLDQVLELACLVAVMAGRSRFRPVENPDPEGAR
jgi:hypothetical protein